MKLCQEHRNKKLNLWRSDSKPQGLSTNWGFNFVFSQIKAWFKCAC